MEYCGIVRWFNGDFDFGYISHRNGEEVFVHHSVIARTKPAQVWMDKKTGKEINEHVKLAKGEWVTYTLASCEKGLRAIEVKRHNETKT